jgi:hypothetical protein
MLFSHQSISDTLISREESKQRLKRMFKHFSDNNSDNGGKHLNSIAIRSSFICEDKYVRVHELI